MKDTEKRRGTEEPSKLEQRLEAFRKETGDIILSPKEAKDILFEPLLSAYRKSVSWPNYPDLTVQVLIRIAEAEGERYDFTEALKKFENEAERERKVEEERKYGEGGLNILRPTPPVREI